MDLLKLLSAGGDVSTMVLVLMAWRFDRRLLVIEEWRKSVSEWRRSVSEKLAAVVG